LHPGWKFPAEPETARSGRSHRLANLRPARIASEVKRGRTDPSGRSMEKFGSYLLRNKILTDAQLDEAVQSQVIFGGRLGTNLAELGYLNLDDLCRYLSEHLAIPVADLEAIEQISDDARNAVSRELVEKYRILPLKLDKRKLHLAMLDPRDPVQLDEIAFATGLTLVPYVLPEVRLLALIEHHYGIRRETRYITLGRDAVRSQHAAPKPMRLADEVAPGAKRGSDDSLAAQKPKCEDLIDEDTFNALHERREQNLRRPAAKPARGPILSEAPFAMEDLAVPEVEIPQPEPQDESTANLEIALARVEDRDGVSELALRIARRYAEAVALFVVRGGTVSGFRGDGDRISEQIGGILLTAEIESALTGPVATRVAFRGPAPEDGIDARILETLGRGDVKEIAVFPILIRDQVVNLLYTDGGGDALGETRFAALGALAKLVSRAYERLIVDKKSALR
jgi:hypothetical protein